MASKKPLAFEDLIAVERVSAPAVHPDGKSIAYVTTKHDHKKNKVSSAIRLLDIETGENRSITPGKGSHKNPSWSPDGRTMAFISDREHDEEKGEQIWLLPMDGGEARRLTSGDGGAGPPGWSPDGKYIAFSRKTIVSHLWDGKLRGKEADLKGEEKYRMVHAKLYSLANPLSTARIESSLLYRHWDSWREMRRSHIFTVNVETGAMTDITLGDADSPPLGLGSSQDYCFSPEGDEIAYVMNPEHRVALSTNNCVWAQKLKSGKPSGKPRLISDTKAVDCNPCYSPDGRWLAYLGAQQPGYEADRMRVKTYDRKTGKTKVLTEDLDRSATHLAWSPDSISIYFLAPDMGRMSVYRVELAEEKKGAKPMVKQMTRGVHNTGLETMPDGRLLLTRESATAPADLHILEPGKGEKPHLDNGPRGKTFGEKTEQLTHHGDWVKKKMDIRDFEEFWYEGADKDMVHGFLLKPPKFNPKNKWRTILIIHGGPQSAFFDNFGYRWNPQLFASEGYVVVMLNPRGSTGYGQEFTDQISGDWGGRCYTDIMKGVAYCLETYDFIDQERMAAAGASFGGFMVNWIAGHTDWFKALVSHDGIFNAETMAYMTEELWFDTWEHGGMPHENHKGYLKYSPHMHVQNFKTPCLVVQGEQDFRCPVSEGIAMFTALQYMGVPSKLLYFPDEGHWVLKPANSQVWYRTILDFIGEHLGKP